MRRITLLVITSLLCVLWPATVSAQTVTNVHANRTASTTDTVSHSGVATSAGDACVVGIAANDETVTITSAPADGTNTYTLAAGPSDAITGNVRQWVYYDLSMAAGTFTISATFSAAPANSIIAVVCYHTTSGTWALDGVDTKLDNANSSAIGFDALTTTGAPGVVIGLAGYPLSRTTATGGTFTSRITGSQRAGIVDLITASTGTYTPEATVIESSVASVTATIALRAGAGGGGASTKRGLLTMGVGR